MKKFNILILEDDIDNYKEIYNYMVINFSSICKISPWISEDKKDFSQWRKLRGLCRKTNTDEILKIYSDTDYFIIDASLTETRVDEFGIDILEDLIKTKNANLNNILVISSSEETKVRKLQEFNYSFVNKMDDPDIYLNHIGNCLKKYLEDSNDAVISQYKVDLSPQIVHPEFVNEKSLEIEKEKTRNLGILELFEQKVIIPLKNFLKNPYVNFKIWYDKSIKEFFIFLEFHIIHKLIILTLDILLLLSVIFSATKLITDFYTEIRYVLGYVNKGVGILVICEHLFLYFLPTFIILGIISYYKLDLKTKLLDGNNYQINEKEAIRSLNMSKTLFLSSILSYTIVKCIESVFADSPNFNLEELISKGVLVIILMVFITLYSRKH